MKQAAHYIRDATCCLSPLKRIPTRWEVSGSSRSRWSVLRLFHGLSNNTFLCKHSSNTCSIPKGRRKEGGFEIPIVAGGRGYSGTGTSTVALSARFPQATRIVTCLMSSFGYDSVMVSFSVWVSALAMDINASNSTGAFSI